MSITVNKTRLPATEWKTASGAVASVSDARGRAAKSVTFDIKAIQAGSGTPSLDNIRSINGWGVNLFDASKAVLTGTISYGFSTELNGDEFHVYGTKTGSATSAAFRITTDASVPYVANAIVYAYDMNDDMQKHFSLQGVRFTTTTGGLAIDLRYLVEGETYDFRFKVMISTAPEIGLTLPTLVKAKKNFARLSPEIHQAKRVQNGITWEEIDRSSVHVSGTATGSSFLTGGYGVTSFFLRTLPAGTYTMSTNFPSETPYKGHVYLYGYKVGSGATATTQIVSSLRSDSSRTFTIDGTWRVNVQMMVASGASIDQDVWVQIERGTQATEYEPYGGEEICVPIFPPNGRNLVDSSKLKNDTGKYNKYNIPNSLKNNTTYTYSVFGDNTYNYRLMAGHTNVPVPQPNIGLNSGYTKAGNKSTFTTPSDIEDWEYLFLGGSAAGAADKDIWIQVEDGSVGTFYEAYAPLIYDATIDLTHGLLTVNKVLFSRNSSTMNNSENYPGWANAGVRGLVGAGLNKNYLDQVMNIGSVFSVNTAAAANDILYLPKSQYDNKTQSEWIALAQDIQIVIPIATPLVFHLTPTQIQMLMRSNNIWSDTGDTSVEYAAIHSH